jgi:hypothetical protein
MLATSFTDAEHYTPITTGVLTRHQAQPGSEMATILKVTPIADSSNHGRGGLGTHASNLSDALASLVGFEDRIYLLVEEANARIDLKHEVIETGDDLPR